MSNVQQQNPDGSWSPATPCGPQPGYDAEIGRTGRHEYAWALYHDCHRLVANGTSWTHTGATLRLVLAKRWDQRRHPAATVHPKVDEVEGQP